MKSFPSSFTKNNLVQTGIASTNIKQTLKNIAGATMNNILSGGADTVKDKKSLGERLQWPEFDYNYALSTVGFTNGDEIYDQTSRLFPNSSDRAVYENANKIPALVLASMNKYRTVYKNSVVQVNPPVAQAKNIKKSVPSSNDSNGSAGSAGSGGSGGSQTKTESVQNNKDAYQEIYQEGASPSLFNPWYGVRSQGFTLNSPLLYIKDGENNTVDVNFDLEKGQAKTQIMLTNADGDFTDCSIKTLVNLSSGKTVVKSKNEDDKKRVTNKRSLGRASYRYADFMYCKDLGKVSNNHLITLRKFTHPIGDNIFKQSNTDPKEAEMLPDSGRLIAWFGTEDNKLEDICKFNYKTTWKEMNAAIEDVQSKEDNPKLLPSLVNLMNPAYRSGAAQGLWGNNAVYNWVESKVSVFGWHPFQAQSSEASDSDRYHMDTNKIWTPKNTIQSTHLYEGKIEFSQEFTLVFSYRLRSYDGINPKSAFLDLIGNILEITHRRGTFWGGARRWLGAPRNQQGWKKMNDLFSKGEAALHSGIEQLFGCSSLEDLANLAGSALKSIGGLIEGAWEQAKEFVSGGGLQTTGKSLAHSAASTLTGMLKNKLGRPAVYAINSLLNGDNVGLWHVTIGNPRNPIMTMGNLILTNSEIQHSGPLGIDDFPTELKVTVTLKHARPRDITEIAQMYTCGQGGLLLPLGSKSISNYIDIQDPRTKAEFGATDIVNADAMKILNDLTLNEADAAKQAEMVSYSSAISSQNADVVNAVSAYTSNKNNVYSDTASQTAAYTVAFSEKTNDIWNTIATITAN